MSERLAVYVTPCPRCGEDHGLLEFRALDEPVDDWTHHARCPVSEAPILLKVTVG
jgi:hypothetical protein